MLDESTYPVAPATIIPTMRPMMILEFRMNGEPNISTRTIVMKLRKPSPMYSADPHLLCQDQHGSETAMETYGNALGALMVGHKAKILGAAGRYWQSFDPPPQLRNPDFPTSEAPIRTTVRPVTRGGNMFRSLFAGTKDMPISKKEQTKKVPRSFPYALDISQA
jgi:hypothetical protein